MRILLRERGKIVPGSRREVNNVVTNIGRRYLAERTAASSFGPIVELTNTVVQYVALGTGTQVVNPEVMRLVTPAQVVLGVYMKAVGAPAIYPIAPTVRFAVSIDPTELILPGPTTDLTEAGLVLSHVVMPLGEGPLDSTIAGHARGQAMPTNRTDFEVAAYCSFERLQKTTDYGMDIQWEWRF